MAISPSELYKKHVPVDINRIRVLSHVGDVLIIPDIKFYHIVDEVRIINS